MKQNLLILLLVFSLVLNLTLIVSRLFQIRDSPPQFVYEELDLSNDQRTQIEAERDGFIRTVNEAGNQMIGKLSELMDLLAAAEVDEAAIEAKLDDMQARHRLMQEAVVRHLQGDRAILNDEQRRQFFSILKDRIRAQGAPGPAWVPRNERRREQ